MEPSTENSEPEISEAAIEFVFGVPLILDTSPVALDPQHITYLNGEGETKERN